MNWKNNWKLGLYVHLTIKTTCRLSMFYDAVAFCCLNKAMPKQRAWTNLTLRPSHPGAHRWTKVCLLFIQCGHWAWKRQLRRSTSVPLCTRREIEPNKSGMKLLPLCDSSVISKRRQTSLQLISPKQSRCTSNIAGSNFRQAQNMNQLSKVCLLCSHIQLSTLVTSWFMI